MSNIFFYLTFILIFSKALFADYTYDEIDVEVELNTVISPSVSFDTTSVTFSDIVPGDNINADVNVTLTGSDNRDFTCNINGNENTNTIELFNNKFTITVSLDNSECEPSESGNILVLSITSDAFPDTVSPSSSDSSTVTFSLLYDTSTIVDYT